MREPAPVSGHSWKNSRSKEHLFTHSCCFYIVIYKDTITFTFTFSHLADAFVQSDVQGRHHKQRKRNDH